MKISTSMKKLYEAYNKGDHSLGCVSRACILCYIMESKGLNPKKKLFSFKDSEGNKVVRNHCIVLFNGKVYDTNIEESQNPMEFNKYEEMKKMEHSELNLVWEDWEKSKTSQDYTIQDLWEYVLKPEFDEASKKELRALMEEDIQKYLKDRPHIKRF